MRKDSHTEVITGVLDGKPFQAILTGVPDDCQHDDDGPALVFNDQGEHWPESDLPDPNTEYAEYEKFYTDHKINGGCVSCSKCGKPFELDLLNMP